MIGLGKDRINDVTEIGRMNATNTFVSFNQNSITEIEFILPEANPSISKGHEVHLRLALACEGGGGGTNGVEMP